jgi:hypothetical protein
LAETREHFWVRFDTGGGMTDADPSFASAAIGDTFTAANDTFAEVSETMRHKVRVQLDREIANTAASALFGLNPLGTATVLNVTFNAVELVGRPLSIGHFVDNHNIAGPVFTSITNTYSPYIAVGDYGAPLAEDHLIRGTDYQEIITSFPFGSTLLTGLFLSVELSGPDGPSETFERTLLDLIGFDVRTNGGKPNLTFDPSNPPSLTPFDVFTLNVLPSEFVEAAGHLYAPQVLALQEQTRQFEDDAIAFGSEASAVAQQFIIGQTRMAAAEVLHLSDHFTEQYANASIVRAYFDRPRIVITSNRVEVSGGDTPTTRFSNPIDLRRTDVRVVVPPGQNVDAAQVFRVARGIAENTVETEVAASQIADVGEPAAPVVSTARVFAEAGAVGIGTLFINESNLSELDTAPFSGEAKARITAAVIADKLVIVPERAVLIGDTEQIAWYEMDLDTGETIGVTEDGGHQALIEYAYTVSLTAVAIGVIHGMVSYIDNLTNCYEPGSGKSLQQCKEEILQQIINPVSPNNLANSLLGAIGAPIFILGGIAVPLEESQIASNNFQGAFAFAGANGWIDPPLPGRFVSPVPMQEFNDLSGVGVATKTVIDPLFTLPFGGAQLPTIFRRAKSARSVWCCAQPACCRRQERMFRSMLRWPA